MWGKRILREAELHATVYDICDQVLEKSNKRIIEHKYNVSIMLQIAAC